MNDNYQDYSTEGTAPVVIPGSASVPEPVVAPDNPILLPAPGPGPSKSPMSKQMKIMLGLFSAVILVSGLVTSLILVKQNQRINSKAGPNICTWETCSTDANGNKLSQTEIDKNWAAGNQAAEAPQTIQHEDKPNSESNRIEAILQASVDRGKVFEVQRTINDNVKSQAGIDSLNQILTGGQINEIKVVPVSNNTNNSGSATTGVTTSNSTGIDGLALTNTVSGQSFDNACNYDQICTTRVQWDKGWWEARNESKYLNQNYKPIRTEYTDVAKDYDPSTPNTQEVGQIEFDPKTGTLEVTNIYTAQANITCPDGTVKCWEEKIKGMPNTPAITVTPVGKIVNGKIVYNQPVSGTTNKIFSGVPKSLWKTTGTCTTQCRGYDNLSSYYCLENAVESVKPTNPGSFTCNSANLAFYGKLETWGCRTSAGAYSKTCDSIYTGDMPIAGTTVNWNGNSFTDINKLLEYLKSKGFKYEINRFSCGKGQTIDQLVAAFDIPTGGTVPGCSQNKESFDQTKNGSTFGFTSTCGIQQIDIDIYNGGIGSTPE
ncbi:MAG: hypothetical protein Q8L51_01650, partial [Candidatus Amesbacteria bacterium]|nr:hypothetical protein [Candidatus Amesbacteria bacterium]